MWKNLALLAVAAIFATSIGCSGGGDDDDDDDDDGAGNTPVTGIAYDENDDPLAGADIEDVESGVSTTTDAAGEFTLLLSSGSTAWIRRTAADYYPYQIGLVVPPGGAAVEIGGPTEGDVDLIAGILGTTIDEADGILAINFDGVGVSTTGGFTATISATADGSFVFAAGGAPQEGNTTIAGQDANVIYYNVETGTSTISVDPPDGWNCTSATGLASYRVDAGVISQAQFDCTD